MELKVRMLLLCFGVFCASSEICGLMGFPRGLQWSRGVIHCPKTLAVMEEAFYSTPSPEVCDAKCRMGPKAAQEDDCYHRNGACVQRAREEEVALLYDSCLPTAAPTWCNFTAGASGLPVSLNVGYSCLEGIIFDPYNATFSWKAKKITLAFHGDDSTPTTLITHCEVNSDSPSPNIKITALKSPPTSLNITGNRTSHMDDITVVVDDVRTDVIESRLPYWWRVKEPRFKIEFRMEVNGVGLHPHWISLEDKSLIEVVCRKMDTSLLTMTTPAPSIIHETLFVINGKAFTLGDVIGAIVCTVAILLIVILVIFLVTRYRKKTWSPDRRRQQRDRDYSNLISRMEFHNRAAESSLTVCSDVSGADSSSEPITAPFQEASGGVGSRNSNPSRLPKGTAISNDTYGICSDTDDLHLPGKQTTSGRGATAAADDTNEDTLPLFGQMPELSAVSGGGGGGSGVGKDWERFESKEGGPRVYQNTQYENVPLGGPRGAKDPDKEHLLH